MLSILAGLTWLGAHLWVLLLALVPQVLAILQPVLAAILGALNAILGSTWEGIKTNKFENWLTVLIVGAIAGVVGYHYGWNACLDWAHAHFRWISKMPIAHWWKFW